MLPAMAGGKSGWQPRCKICVNVRRFGITRADYEAMLEAQGGVCWICKREQSSGRLLAIDHDHSTGDVRGLLCTRCNQGLGFFQDNIDYLAKAIEYLKTRG